MQLRGDTAEEMIEEARALKSSSATTGSQNPHGPGGAQGQMTLSKEMPLLRDRDLLPAAGCWRPGGASFVAASCQPSGQHRARAWKLPAISPECLTFGWPALQVVGASFKNVDQGAGMRHGRLPLVTLKAEMFDMLAGGHPLTDSGIAGFDKGLEGVLQRKQNPRSAE